MKAPVRKRGQVAKRKLAVTPRLSTLATEADIKCIDLTAEDTARVQKKRRVAPSQTEPKKCKSQKKNKLLMETQPTEILHEAFNATVQPDSSELSLAVVCFCLGFHCSVTFTYWPIFNFQAVLAENVDYTLPDINVDDIDWDYGTLNFHDMEQNVWILFSVLEK